MRAGEWKEGRCTSGREDSEAEGTERSHIPTLLYPVCRLIKTPAHCGVTGREGGISLITTKNNKRQAAHQKTDAWANTRAHACTGIHECTTAIFLYRVNWCFFSLKNPQTHMPPWITSQSCFKTTWDAFLAFLKDCFGAYYLYFN